MPKIWTQSIDTHRQQVHDAILAAAADLAAEHGPLALTMSSIADRAGIGRATLYKYFPDIESILFAWHQRELTHHLDRLRELSSDRDVTLQRLASFIVDLRTRALGLKQRGIAAEEAGRLLTDEFKKTYPDWPIKDVTGFVKSIYAE